MHHTRVVTGDEEEALYHVERRCRMLDAYAHDE